METSAQNDMVSMSEASRLEDINRSTVKRYVDKYGSEIGVTGEGRALRFSLTKFREHRAANFSTPIDAGLDGEPEPLPEIDDKPSPPPADAGPAKPLNSEDTKNSLQKTAAQLKLRREALKLEQEEIDMALRKGQLVHVAEIEGLGALVGSRICERLTQIINDVIGDVRTANSDRELNLLVKQKIQKFRAEMAEIFELQATGRETEN